MVTFWRAKRVGSALFELTQVWAGRFSSCVASPRKDILSSTQVLRLGRVSGPGCALGDTQTCTLPSTLQYTIVLTRNATHYTPNAPLHPSLEQLRNVKTLPLC